MQNRTIEIAVGLFVIAGFFALLGLTLKVGNLGSERKEEAYHVKAAFTNIGGLKVRAPVKSAGVLVGRVNAIQFDSKNYQAVVDLELFTRFPFPKDSSASILTSGLLGEVYIGLEAGGDDANLNEGDKIKIAQSAVVLEKLIGQFLFQKASEGTPAPAGGAAAAPPAVASGATPVAKAP
jgi:phospholipid/cholesterol/gamma-HCH transport system substrate-binding protein